MTDYDDLLRDLDEPIIAVGDNEEEEDNGIIIGNPEGGEEEEEEEDMIIYATTDESRRRKDDRGYYGGGDEDDDEYFDDDEDKYKNWKREIVPTNPDLPMYKVRITFLDESSSEYTVTEDWTVGNLIASISESIGLLRLTDLFFLSEGIRNTLMEPSATNEVWLPLDAPLPSLSITPSRLHDATARPIYFRMRWFRLPACGLTSPAIIHQMYLHARRSLTCESVRIGVREAGELGGLQLQAALGNYARGEQHQAGSVANAGAGTYFSEALVAHGEATREELEGLIFQAHEKCQGLAPLDAERKYVEDASRCRVPMFGASVFRVKGSTGAERHLGVLRDGLVVDIGTFEGFRFHPYKDVVAAALGGGGENEGELTVTVRVPVTAGTALGDRTPTETMRFATPEAPAIVDLMYGYMALLGRGERAVPREKVPPGLPPAELFQEQEPREVLVPYATLVDFFYAMLGSMFEEQRAEPPEHVMCAVEYAHATDSVLDAVSFAPYSSAPPLKPAHVRTLGLAVARISNYADKRGVIANVRFTAADFSGCNIAENAEVLPAIKAVCRSPAPLTRLTLRGIGLTHAFGGEIGEAAGSVHTLQELVVAHNPLLGNPGANALLKGLEKLTGSLAKISLADTDLSVPILPHIADYLSKHSHVKSLSLARNPELAKAAKKKHQFAEAVLEMLEKTALTELDITACEVGKADLLKIVMGLPDHKSFKKLHIGLNPGVNDKLVNTVTSWAESGSMFLSLLDVAGCKVGKKPLAALLKGVVPSSSYFTDLVLRGVPLHKSLAPALADLGKSRIAHLDLTDTGLSDPRLLDALAAAVEQSKTLVELRVAGNALPAKSLKGLADAVMACPTLVTLDAGGCGLKGKEAAAFIQGLKGHKALSVLILDKIKTSDVVYDALTDLLAVDSSPISNLSMREISFSMKTLNAFLEGLPDSVSLPCLDLRDNKIKHDSLKKVPNVYILL